MTTGILVVVLAGIIGTIGLYVLVQSEHANRKTMPRAEAEETVRRDRNSKD